MKKKIVAGTVVATVATLGFICLCMWLLSGADSTYYYVQINNSKAEQGKPRNGVIDLHGGMAYSYTLPAYDESGSEKEITFGTSRKLREDAFIRLTVMPIRGVIEWSEVQHDELPRAVQSHYAAEGFGQK